MDSSSELRRSIKWEQVAWVLLMASFVAFAGYFVERRESLTMELRRTSRPALMEQARKLEMQGDIEAAEKLHRRLAVNYGHREDVLLAYADFLARRQRDAEAESLYRQAIESGSNRALSLRRYAALLDRQNRSEEVSVVYEGYLRRCPKDTIVRLDFGKRLAAAGKFEASAPHLKAAAANPALTVEAEKHLAQALLALGRLAEAAEIWARLAQEPAPERQVFWQDVADAYETLKKDQAALLAWIRFLQQFPNSIRAAERLAALCRRAGYSNELAKVSLRLAVLAPDVRIEQSLGGALKVVGGSGDRTCKPGGILKMLLLFEPVDTITRSGATEFKVYLVRDKSPVQLRSEPTRLGPVPLWRGDCIRQPISAVVPDRFPPGTYQLAVALESAPETRVTLWPVEITGAGP